MSVLETTSGTLPVGIKFAGALHTAFTMRRSKVADTLAAFDEVGGESELKLECAQIARQLVSLGDIPAESITTKRMFDLDELDFETLAAARGLLAKKPSRWPASQLPDWSLASDPPPAVSAPSSSA